MLRACPAQARVLARRTVILYRYVQCRDSVALGLWGFAFRVWAWSLGFKQGLFGGEVSGLGPRLLLL